MLARVTLAATLVSTFLPTTADAAGCSRWWFTSGGYTDTRHKILLVHGISGFDTIGGIIGYFHTIPMNLCRSGADVEVADVSAFNDSESRGLQLAQDINANRYGSGKFNVIAHSQGAPTARAAITFDAAMNPLGGGRIASVTSVGGVNKGSAVADVIRGLIPPGSPIEGGAAALANAVGRLIDVLSGNNRPQNALAGLNTLTTPLTEDLNRRHPYGVASGYCTNDRAPQVTVNGNTISIYSWAGRSVLTNPLDGTDPFLAITALSFGFESNDGLVSVCSQKLGRYIGAFRANHLDEVNHLLGLRSIFHNPVTVYRQHANRLKNAGL